MQIEKLELQAFKFMQVKKGSDSGQQDCLKQHYQTPQEQFSKATFETIKSRKNTSKFQLGFETKFDKMSSKMKKIPEAGKPSNMSL